MSSLSGIHNRVAVLMTVHNRRAKTIQTITSLQQTMADAGAQYRIYLVDADSTDGTADAVRSIEPNVILIKATDQTYWAAGMYKAWRRAQGDSDWDTLLWLNDDVKLATHAWGRTLQHLSLTRRQCVVVGAFRDQEGHPSYGGFNARSATKPLHFEAAHIEPQSQVVDTLNGNYVAVDRLLDAQIGGFPARYTHNLADLAYGLSATRMGIEVQQLPDAVGECDRDRPEPISGIDSARERLRRQLTVKRYPLGPWARFTTTYGGAVAPIYFVRPYLKAVLNHE